MDSSRRGEDSPKVIHTHQGELRTEGRTGRTPSHSDGWASGNFRVALRPAMLGVAVCVFMYTISNRRKRFERGYHGSAHGRCKTVMPPQLGGIRPFDSSQETTYNKPPWGILRADIISAFQQASRATDDSWTTQSPLHDATTGLWAKRCCLTAQGHVQAAPVLGRASA